MAPNASTTTFEVAPNVKQKHDNSTTTEARQQKHDNRIGEGKDGWMMARQDGTSEGTGQITLKEEHKTLSGR